MSLDHLSVSRIMTYTHCGERDRLRYVEGKREAESPAKIRGLAVHHAVAANMRAKREGTELPLAQIEEATRDATVALFETNDVVLNSGESEEGLAVTKGKTTDVAVALSRKHAVSVAPGIDPVAIEQRIKLEVGGLPRLEGVLDLTSARGNIHDTKTTTRTPDGGAAHRSLQLSMYHLLYQAFHAEPPRLLVLDHLVWKEPSKKFPAGIAQWDPRSTTRTPEALQAFLDRVFAVASAIEKGIVIPADTESWKCSPKYCGFFGRECRFTRGLVKEDS